MAIRVCLIVTDAVSFNVLYRGQLEFLQQAGLDITMLCGGSESELARLRSRKVGRVIDMGIVRQPSPVRDFWSLTRLVVHLLVHRYEVVLSTTPKALLLGSIASWVACQRHRIVFFQGRVYENLEGLRRRVYAEFDRLAIRLSTRALFVSPSLRAAYEVEGLLSPGQGEVVGAGSVNGVDTERFSPDHDRHKKRALEDALAIPEGNLVVVVVGRICPDKGMTELAQIASLLVNEKVTFVVVGPVEEEYEAYVDLLLAMPNVRHVPFTPHVEQYFVMADIHLFLSHREGFGNVALEAAACGVPTIAFDVVGVRDSVANGISGLRLPFADLKSVQDAIRAALHDPQAFRDRFAGSRSWVESTYASIRVWQAYLALFKECRR